jgi:hypothetical protein
MHHYLAMDLGAESGRAMLGTITEGKLALEELHRFPNTPVRIPQGLYWDTFRLWHEIQQGMAVAGRERKLKLDGIGIDTWGVDFGLFGADGALVDNPRHYRDARNAVDERFRGMSGAHTVNNACLTIFGLAIGGTDVTKVLSETIAMGLDNDCTAATAGSIVGAMVGKDGVPAHWTKPFNNTVHSYLNGRRRFTISGLVKRFTKQM